jgi:hypothetical protein
MRGSGESLTAWGTTTSAGSTVAMGTGTVTSSEKIDSTAPPTFGISARSVAPVRNSNNAAARNVTTSSRFQNTSGQGSTAKSGRNPSLAVPRTLLRARLQLQRAADI